MNRRTLKKKCKRAVAILIAQHGYKAADFQPSDGCETCYAPPRMERRPGRQSDYLHPLKGTLLLWARVSYECDEWDPMLPSVYLSDIEFWAKFEPTEADLAA